MRHAATAFSLCIALVSGIVFALLWGQTPLRSMSIQAESSSDVEETVLAFYRAVNGYLGDGDPAPLSRMLHPDFVDHDPGQSAGGNAATFLQQLDSVRSLSSGIRLTPKMVYLGNSAASVSLSLSDRQRHAFAGIGIDPVELVGRLDVLRVERRLIVERWSSASLAGELQAFPAISLELPFALNTLIARVQQLSLDGPSEPAVDPFGHLLLIVHSGEARLDVMEAGTIPVAHWQVDDGRVADPVPVEPGTTVTLDQMDAVLLPAGTQFRMWDEGSESANVLALEFGPPVSGERFPKPSPVIDELNETLWSGISLSGVGKRLTLSFGRATLLPQATLPSRQVEGMELIWVGGGSIDMSTSSGTARVRDASGTRAQLQDGHALLQAGDAGAAGPGSDIDYQVTGGTSATVWFFSLVPTQRSKSNADAPARTPTAPPARTAS